MSLETPQTRTRTRAAAPSRKTRLPLVVVGLVVLAGAAVGVFLFLRQQGADRREAGEAEYASAPVMEAEALVQAWKKDKDGYDRQHRGHAVAVTGVVDSRESVEGAYGAGQVLKVFLQGAEGTQVLCQIDADHVAPLAGVARGERVTIVGRYAGDDGYGSLVVRNARKR